jgi:Protein of unknown function (DUF3169)
MTQVTKIERIRHEKESDRKYFTRLIAIICICLVAGGGIGFYSVIARALIKANANAGIMNETFQSYAGLITLAISVVGTILIVTAAFYHYSRAKKLSLSWDGDDEVIVDAIEGRLNIAMFWNNLLMIYSFLFFALVFHTSGIIDLAERIAQNPANLEMLRVISFLGSFPTLLAGIIFNLVVYKCVVDLRKKLSPEKQGSIFDFRFDKKWEASCDEAEKQAMYKAAYKAFQATNMTCIVIWLIAFLAQIVMQTGVFPIVCVCAIWLVLNVSYSITAMKQAKRKS